MDELVRTRIAPTPSGYLHIGNAYNFLLTEELAKANGSVRLRIDDVDTARMRPGYVADIFDSLEWLGIQYDEGPRNAVEQELAFSQRLRGPLYDTALEQLVAMGLVFACECSRRDLQQSAGDGQYAGTCIGKNIPLDVPDVAWRVRTPREQCSIAFEDGIMGRQVIDLWRSQRYFIVRRRDGIPAYQVASVADDMDHRINTIIRGQDLLSSTAAQLYLAQVLGYSSFQNTHFYHHPLIADREGQKLSKSAGSTSLRALRETGISAATVRREAEVWYTPLLRSG